LLGITSKLNKNKWDYKNNVFFTTGYNEYFNQANTPYSENELSLGGGQGAELLYGISSRLFVGGQLNYAISDDTTPYDLYEWKAIIVSREVLLVFNTGLAAGAKTDVLLGAGTTAIDAVFTKIYDKTTLDSWSSSLKGYKFFVRFTEWTDTYSGLSYEIGCRSYESWLTTPITNYYGENINIDLNGPYLRFAFTFLY
jgi:hypothetical protein